MYTDLCSFHWSTDLTTEEKKSIIKFVGAMTDSEKKMLRQIVKDEIDEENETNGWGI